MSVLQMDTSVNVTMSTDCSPFKLIIVNCQSLIAKKASFLNMINDQNPDFIVGQNLGCLPTSIVVRFSHPRIPFLDETEMITMEEFLLHANLL